MAATEGGRQVANFGAGPAKLPRSVSRGTAGLGVLVPPAPRGAPTAKRGLGKLIDRNYRSLPAQRRNLVFHSTTNFPDKLGFLQTSSSVVLRILSRVLFFGFF